MKTLFRNLLAFLLGGVLFVAAAYAYVGNTPFYELLIPVLLITGGALIGKRGKTIEFISVIGGYLITYFYVVL